MMRIYNVITTINRGGAENQLFQMLLEQKKNGIDVCVIYLKGNGYWSKKFKSYGIKSYGPIFPKGNYFNLGGYKKLKKLLRKNPEIIHAHMPPSLLVCVLFKIFSKRFPKLIYTSHNECPFIKLPFIELFFVKFLFLKTDRIITVSGSGKEYIVNRYRVNKRKISIISHCINKECYNLDFNSSLKELSFYSERDKYIGTIARLVPQKRIDLLLNSFSLIYKKNENMKLVIIGSGFLKKSLLKNAKKLKIPNEKVIWIQYSENILQHLKKWDLLCLTSEYEGFGVVLLEAILTKTPILAMDVSSIKETIGQCGEVVPFNNCKAFSNKILQMIENKTFFIHPEYLQEFSPYKNYLSHLKIYKELLKN